MNVQIIFGAAIVVGIYGLIVFGVYLILRKSSKYLASRILLPTDKISLYLQEIDISREERVRKEWFISFILVTIFGAIFSFLTGVNSGYFNAIGAIAFTLLPLIPSTWITYHCAYKKRGSAFLLYLIIFFPTSIFCAGLQEYIRPNMIWSPLLITSLIIYLPLGLLFWINCIRLRTVNLQRRFHKNALLLKEQFASL